MIDFGLQRKLYNSILGVHHHFQNLRWRSTKYIKGIELNFAVLKPKERVEKTGIESDLNFLHSKCCLELWLISKVLEVQKLQDQCCWKEDLSFYNFFRNRDFWIRTFFASNLARNRLTFNGIQFMTCVGNALLDDENGAPVGEDWLCMGSCNNLRWTV